MSVLGLTIDYGPYSFVDNYDPLFTPNTTDLPGRRYAFSRQAAVAKWNLGALGGAIVSLVGSEAELMPLIDRYDDLYWKAFYPMMGNKLGLDEIKEDDVSLISALEKMLSTIQPDMTIFYQLLINLPEEAEKEKLMDHFKESFYNDLSEQDAGLFFQWMQQYAERRKRNTISTEESVQRMRKNNPRFILRNYLLHQSIEDLEKGDDSLFVKLQQAMKEPYSSNHDEFFKKRPSWATQKAGCSMLSCSS
jgi:serine/tyrosine/threonine adenylyltransferase